MHSKKHDGQTGRLSGGWIIQPPGSRSDEEPRIDGASRHRPGGSPVKDHGSRTAAVRKTDGYRGYRHFGHIDTVGTHLLVSHPLVAPFRHSHPGHGDQKVLLVQVRLPRVVKQGGRPGRQHVDRVVPFLYHSLPHLQILNKKNKIEQIELEQDLIPTRRAGLNLNMDALLGILHKT